MSAKKVTATPEEVAVIRIGSSDSLATIGKELGGVSRQRVHQLVRESGIPVSRRPKQRLPDPTLIMSVINDPHTTSWEMVRQQCHCATRVIRRIVKDLDHRTDAVNRLFLKRRLRRTKTPHAA